MTPSKNLAILLWCLLIAPFASGTHIAGGEVTYTYLGPDRYLVRLTMFVDCFNGSSGAIALDSTAIFAYYDAVDHSFINYDDIRRSAPTRIKELHYNCVKFSANACVDQYIYEYEKNIDPGTNGVIIAFQRCCRNGTISNLVNPQDVGATYMAYIPPDTLIAKNSSPYFKKLPPNFLCINAPLIFDHSAIDPDGDSLVYSLVAPFDGATPASPRPVPPSNPPYFKVQYISPYSVSEMMGSNSALKIDPETGELRVTPEKKGQFVVGIKVAEYRNGLLVSEVIRDYQFNVYDCEFETQANFINPERVCNDTVYFTDKSSKATFYHWDFGVDNQSDDTSSAVNPYWHYKQQGKYKVTLIVGNQGCKDTFYNFVTIVDKDSIDAFFDPGITSGCDSVTICVENKGDTTPDWFWNWGDGSPVIVNRDTLCHTYKTPGIYLTTLTIIDSTKCNITDTYSVPVTVYNQPDARFTLDTSDCFGLVSAQAVSTEFANVEWFFTGIDTTITNNFQPQVRYTVSGDYSVRLIVSNGNCSDTVVKTFTIDLENIVSPDIEPMVDPGCVPVTVHFSVPPGKTGSNWWEMGDGTKFRDTMIDAYVYTKPGTYTVKYTVVDSSSCNKMAEMQFTFTIFEASEPSFTLDMNSCTGELNIDNSTSGGQTFFWDFGDGVYSNRRSPRHKYITRGQYEVVLYVDSSGPCPVSLSRTFEADFADLSELFLPNIFTPNMDGLNDCYSISGLRRDCYNYTFIVYNRWGEKVYETNDLTSCWNGDTETGLPLPEGTYFAIYRLDETETEKSHNFSGTITVIR